MTKQTRLQRILHHTKINEDETHWPIYTSHTSGDKNFKAYTSEAYLCKVDQESKTTQKPSFFRKPFLSKYKNLDENVVLDDKLECENRPTRKDAPVDHTTKHAYPSTEKQRLN